MRREDGEQERKPEVLALIPARSGSKSVPDKNIRSIAGRPLLAWSIEHAKQAKSVTRVILSTDSERYAEIGREYGAEVPFLRPAEYATDTATDLEVFEHALRWLEEHEGYRPDAVVQLRPTCPVRDPADIDRMVKLLLDDPEADSVRSVAPATEIPYKMWLAESMEESAGQAESAPKASGHEGCEAEATGKATAGCVLKPLMTDIPECYNMPRQQLPKVYYQNACIDITRPETVLNKHSMTGNRILGYVMKENYDIDTEAELQKAAERLERRQHE